MRAALLALLTAVACTPDPAQQARLQDRIAVEQQCQAEATAQTAVSAHEVTERNDISTARYLNIYRECLSRHGLAIEFPLS
jgi:hypothetical protein